VVTLKTPDRGFSACVEIATGGDANLRLHLLDLATPCASS